MYVDLVGCETTLRVAADISPIAVVRLDQLSLSCHFTAPFTETVAERMFPPLRRFNNYLAANWQQVPKTAQFGCPERLDRHLRNANACAVFEIKFEWRRCMGVEPTLDQEAGRATVLKTACLVILSTSE